MLEVVVRGIHGHRAEANSEREERLCNGGVPHRRVQDLVPRGLEEEDDAVDRSFQRHRADQQTDHHEVREEGQEVGGFTGALHALADHHVNEDPAGQQRQHQLPRGQPESIFDSRLVENEIPERSNRVNPIMRIKIPSGSTSKGAKSEKR